MICNKQAVLCKKKLSHKQWVIKDENKENNFFYRFFHTESRAVKLCLVRGRMTNISMKICSTCISMMNMGFL